ncbi:family 16 glycoside hydrolase [Horticoccus sp. 23ND18S-11]|uniref:family 16 glycoside hydrolase n=1 Tax=Horticoccus sp. 23ND18S-11 TaxID=3391832 RepID=UPI0039C9BA1F
MPLSPRLWYALLASVPALLVHAQTALPLDPVKLDTLAAFRPVTANWKLAADVAGDPRRDKVLATTDGTGVLVCNPGKEPPTRGHLFTAWEHGDLELELDFLLTPGSNSGVYLQGRYEVQLFDSWGKRDVTPGDNGGIYERWDAARGKGKEGYEGHAPRVNASRAPGLWQHVRIEFEAPRFDAAGKKTKNARFVRVVLNGFTIHENVEVKGPTRSAAYEDEKPLGPIMIQGDHGAVALRDLRVKRFDAGVTVATENLRYKLYTGDLKGLGTYDAQKPASEGVPARFSINAVEKTGRFALVFTGSIVAPRAGAYRFALETGSPARLLIDGRPVAIPVDRGAQPGVVTLTAGKHDFRLDLLHQANNRPSLELTAEGPGIAPHALTVRDAPMGGRGPRGAAAAGRQLLVEPKDRTLLQRGFVPFEPRKRLYAASVGTPAGVHFAYDFETGTVLRAWRGSFVDTFQMWDGRGNDQTAKPAGPAITFHGKPTIALIEYAANGDWPDQPDALWSSQGYELEADGTPVFLSRLADIAVRDRIAPIDGRSLKRTLQLKGSLPSWSTWVLLAEAETITPQPDGSGWIIGAREWFLDWPKDAAQRPIVRSVNGRQQLAVPLTGGSLEKPISYSIVW